MTEKSKRDDPLSEIQKCCELRAMLFLFSVSLRIWKEKNGVGGGGGVRTFYNILDLATVTVCEVSGSYTYVSQGQLKSINSLVIRAFVL